MIRGGEESEVETAVVVGVTEAQRDHLTLWWVWCLRDPRTREQSHSRHQADPPWAGVSFTAFLCFGLSKRGIGTAKDAPCETRAPCPESLVTNRAKKLNRFFYLWVS